MKLRLTCPHPKQTQTILRKNGQSVSNQQKSPRLRRGLFHKLLFLRLAAAVLIQFFRTARAFIGGFRWHSFHLLHALSEHDRNLCRLTGSTRSRSYFAFLLFSQMAKTLFSVSRHTTKYPIVGTAILGTTIFPPSFSTFTAYSSIEGTSM